jgi:hypothetical protein
MNWLERARREIRESTPIDTANSAERSPTAVMAVRDPAIRAESQACARDLEGQTSQRAHGTIQKSMERATANTAEINLTALLAVPHPVNCANFAGFADGGKRLGRHRWSAADWQAFFEERASMAEADSGLPRAQAEVQSFAHCVDQWLSRNPIRSPPGRCLGCGSGDHGHDPLKPFGVDLCAWLHSRCWPNWLASRRAEAVAALKAIGSQCQPRI